ncbi:domain-containing 15 [Octopus vulgaris]|uniref:Domain-containing 15 n=1 Tax=Octopus vulgaris TaxID=6645 RepID=A0AA36F6I8_OCTVU|nr:domain-containing 15 [Octopus vulgaris]
MAAPSLFVCVYSLAVFVTLVTSLQASDVRENTQQNSKEENPNSGQNPPTDSATKDSISPETVVKPLDGETESSATDATQKTPEETTQVGQEKEPWQEWVSLLIPESVQYSFWAFISDLQKEIELYIKAEETNTAEEGVPVVADSSTTNGTTDSGTTAPVDASAEPTTNTSSNSSAMGEISAADQDKNETISKKPRFHCTGKNITENTTGSVQMVNGTTLLQKLTFENNATGSDCILVFFYAPWCHFSAQASPSYNTLGRAFPQLDIVAVDAVQFSSLNARFGVVSVPNIMFFHHSRSVVRFNSSKKTFENMALFVKNMTGLEADASVEVSEQDMTGPLSSMATTEPDCLLYLAWIFINICSLYAFYSSSIGQHMINKIHTLWQEHQHIE